MNSFRIPLIDSWVSSENFKSIAEIQAMQINAFAEQLKGIDFSYVNEFTKNISVGLQSIINSIPKYNFADAISPFIQRLAEVQTSFAPYYQSAVEHMSNALSSIDFSMMSYHREWNEKHDFLITHGWFYLNELPDEIIDEIYSQKETITSDYINTLICSHFRDNKCTALKKIVKTWQKSPYFKIRGHIFHQALVNHSRRYYNTAITLLTIHTEGVLTDFMRLKLQAPRFKAKKAIMEIRDTIGDMPLSALSLSDWRIYDEILEKILLSFTEGFDHANPDNASNSSRDKIAHGHVLDTETEVNSLKRFFYLNEVFRLLSSLDKLLSEQEDEINQQA